MKPDYKNMSVFEQVMSGFEDLAAFARGEISLRTTTLPSPAPKAKAKQIVSLRKRLKMSQAVFAATLNVSCKTVQSWEQGLRKPSDVALRMLQVIQDNPSVVKTIFGRPARASRLTSGHANGKRLANAAG